MSALSGVAATAGACPSTASRVLSGKDNRLISEAVAELHYPPSAVARSLATGYSNTAASCCHPIYDSGIGEPVRTVHDTVRAAGYHLLVVDSQDMRERREFPTGRRADAGVRSCARVCGGRSLPWASRRTPAADLHPCRDLGGKPQEGIGCPVGQLPSSTAAHRAP